MKTTRVEAAWTNWSRSATRQTCTAAGSGLWNRPVDPRRTNFAASTGCERGAALAIFVPFIARNRGRRRHPVPRLAELLPAVFVSDQPPDFLVDVVPTAAGGHHEVAIPEPDSPYLLAVVDGDVGRFQPLLALDLHLPASDSEPSRQLWTIGHFVPLIMSRDTMRANGTLLGGPGRSGRNPRRGGRSGRRPVWRRDHLAAGTSGGNSAVF